MTSQNQKKEFRCSHEITKLLAYANAICFMFIFQNGALAQSFNRTQTNMATTIGTACQQGPTINEANFQARCDAVAIASGGPDNIVMTTDLEVENAIQRVSPEQTIAPGTQATRTSAGQSLTVGNVISSRLFSLRAELEGTSFAGMPSNGDANLLGQPNGSLQYSGTGGAAGDSDFNRLSFWAQGTYNFGSLESSAEQIGFQFDNWGMTAGVDYRFTDRFILGAAFSYLGADGDIARAGGSVDSDNYTGSIYGSFYVTDQWYVDAIASYGESEYDIDRSISYTIVDPAIAGGGDNVNTTAKGSPDGQNYSFGLGSGYQLDFGALNVIPYARFNYLESEVDNYSESGGDGWGQRFSKQRFRSLTSILGAQANYALSVPWGIVTSQVHAEWVHEYKDNRREITTSFLGDGNSNPFKIVSSGPDRNYYVTGLGFTSAFAQGLSAYLAYDALVGYSRVNSHRVMLGIRAEF